MRVELNQNENFTKQQSYPKLLKLEQRRNKKQLKLHNSIFSPKKSQLNIQVIDPLAEQLKKYKNKIQFQHTKKYEPFNTKASQKLKKYINQQEKKQSIFQESLRCIKGNSIGVEQKGKRGRGKDYGKLENIERSLTQSSKGLATGSQKEKNVIDIPKISEFFKNQQKQFVLNEAKIMRSQLDRAISLVQNGVNKIKSLTFRGAIINQQSAHSRRNSYFSNSAPINPQQKSKQYLTIQQNQIDKIIQKKLTISKKLRQKVYLQKSRSQNPEQSPQPNSQKKIPQFLPQIASKPKKKIFLKGIKRIPHPSLSLSSSEPISITPATSLLISLSQISLSSSTLESNLYWLVHNSYQNRSSILAQKQQFYSNPSPMHSLSPSSQYKIHRKIDKKLFNKVKANKSGKFKQDQIEEKIFKFIEFLKQIKNRHEIIDESMIGMLEQVRAILIERRFIGVMELRRIFEKEKQGQRENNLKILKRLEDIFA